jgi:hypothetical protein
VTINRADEMTPGILWEELAMNDVNVLPGI